MAKINNNLEISPTKIPEDESYEEVGEASGDQLRADLTRKYEEIKNKERSVITQGFINANKLKRLKIDILKRIFAALSELGVDPSNPESINQFLAGLEEQDPDLFELFETAINALSPEMSASPAGESESEMSPLVERYRTLQKRV